nr:FAD-dependent oxidoreductase [Paraconexibacter algicola]
MSALRVAIVGAGPAGAYAAEHLLRAGNEIEIELIDRLPTPWGLVRAGVSPDHQDTKAVTRNFEEIVASPQITLRLGVEVGRDVSHEELLAHHHAVLYTVGAPGGRRLGVEGEDLPGSFTATDFVGWYNGHPDHQDLPVDLGTERAVIVGNGNVAFDVARMLTLPADVLAATDISDTALAALRESRVREVVVLARRGPAQAAFTSPELLALMALPGVDVTVEPASALDEEVATPRAGDARGYGRSVSLGLLRELAAREPSGAERRIVLRFLGSPVALHGEDRVTAITIGRNELETGMDGRTVVRPTGDEEQLEAGLVLKAIGYHGRAVPGVPFDEAAGVIPNDGGRVTETDGAQVPGVYVSGWIKRGPSGVIGTNKHCAGDTVEALLADHAAGHLAAPTGDGAAFAALLGERVATVVDLDGWQALDAHERAGGAAQGRPRVKVTDVEQMLAVVSGG